jgi:transcriptional regulator with XRE-family HTH domain
MMAVMTRLVAEQLEAFGKRLKLLREVCGYPSQQTFADALGMEKGTLGQYEAGRSYPKPDVLGRIRQLTGATVDWLYFGDAGGLPVALAQRIQEAINQAG